MGAWQARVGHEPVRCRFAMVTMLAMLFVNTVSLASEVRHTLSYPQDREQYILVRSEFPVSTAMTELMMPSWTPGSYLIRNYAANVNRLLAVSGEGDVLQVRKVSKDRWQVNTEGVTRLIVDYEVFTPEINVNNSWVSRSFTLINGASVFLYTAASRQLPQWLDIAATPERGEIFTALPVAVQERGFQAASYDELVDNPVAVANAPSYRFSSGGQDYVLVNVGENEFWDGKRAVRDLEKIVKETQSFWRDNPLSRPYWFLNFAVEAGGGLEHDHSTVVLTGRRQMQDRKKYIQWLGIMAHEFFHVWNVRRMRPAGLAEVDYQREQYTTELWLAEGLTSYYDNLMLVRAGLINPDEYMELLAKDIHRLETTPGRKLRPVTEASLDAWIRHYKPNSNSVNSTISYYTKGAVIGFVLDTFLRKQSKGRHDLDEVMRKMYSLYSRKPYGNDAFAGVLRDVAGEDAVKFLEKLLDSTDELDVDSAFDWFGLELDREWGVISAGLDGDEAQTGFGVVWENDKSSLVVKSVLAGSSGAFAGIIAGDEVLAIGNERVTHTTLDGLMSSYAPGDQTGLLLSRRGRIIDLEVKMETATPERFDVELKKGFGKRHVKRLQVFLGQSFRLGL